ncbi:RNA polymerase sigma factor [Algibacter sp.]|uniref:RNA polymerase sigma factor n=1 Tax=Algibacter sp. TaxID=1872428 RepID=UPI003C79070F
MKNDKAIDGLLVRQFQSGNTIALTKLVKRWHKTFCEKAYWIVKDADVAKDIAQDSWSIIINKINQLKTPESFGSWALQIVYSKSLDWIKAKKRKQQHNNAYKQEQTILAIEIENDDLIKKQLLKTIKSLSTEQQTVIQLFYVQDYSLNEISAFLNIPTGTVKSRLFHAREKLKQKLKHKNYEK